MAANVDPIYSRLSDIQWIDGIVTANTTKDGASGTVFIVFVADATNGGYAQKIRFRAKGTNVATVCRIFINNGGVTTTAANNALFDEITLPATTLSEVAALTNQEVELEFALPAGYRIFVTIGTAVAAGYMASVIGGKY